MSHMIKKGILPWKHKLTLFFKTNENLKFVLKAVYPVAHT